MARQNEILCLNQVRKAFASPVSSPSLFCNADNERILGMLKSARENDKPNEFPDFICDGGFIEHFEVSPSKEGRKGSTFKREKSKAESETKEQFKEWDAVFLASEAKPHTMQTASIENRYEGFSHLAFIASLRRNVSAHLDSLKKQGLTGLANTAFMGENSGAKLCVYEGGAFSRFYTIRSDREALEVLRLCSPLVCYFIFVAGDSVEILDLSELDELILAAPEHLDVRSGRLRDIDLKVYIDW